ncbi:MAG: hypothetical protein EOM29_10185 [Bacteroidia bacterium]|nr:hypothetical protein [Bacteroidia bacterium]
MIRDISIKQQYKKASLWKKVLIFFSYSIYVCLLYSVVVFIIDYLFWLYDKEFSRQSILSLLLVGIFSGFIFSVFLFHTRLFNQKDKQK